MFQFGKGVLPEVGLQYLDSCGKVMEKQKETNVEQEVVINENIQAPVQKGQKLGEVKFKLDGEIVGTVDLVACDSIEKINFLSISKRIINRWFFLWRV